MLPLAPDTPTVTPGYNSVCIFNKEKMPRNVEIQALSGSDVTLSYDAMTIKQLCSSLKRIFKSESSSAQQHFEP